MRWNLASEVSRLTSKLNTIYGVKDIVRYREEFVTERFVISRFLCFFSFLLSQVFGFRLLHRVLISFRYDHRNRRRFLSRAQATRIGHLRVPKTLTFKVRPSTQPF